MRAAQELLGALTIGKGSAWPRGGGAGSQRSQISLPSSPECTKTKPKWPLNHIIVPYHGSWDRDVVLVRRTISLGKPWGVGTLDWGGNVEGTVRGRSVYEQPGAKVDGIASRQRRVSK